MKQKKESINEFISYAKRSLNALFFSYRTCSVGLAMLETPKPKVKVKNVIIVFCTMLFCFFGMNCWNDITWRFYLNKALQKHYTEEQIAEKNLFLTPKKHELVVSDGSILPSSDYTEIKTQVFNWSYIPSVIIAFIWLAWLACYLRKFDNAPTIHSSQNANAHKNCTKK